MLGYSLHKMNTRKSYSRYGRFNPHARRTPLR